MNRETESHFANLPQVKIGRSKLTIPFTNSGTCNAADIIPIYWQECLPGDQVKMRMSSMIRMTTPIVPVADNAFTDIMFFFVPNRLTWDHWPQFWGETDDVPWIQPVDYVVPKTVAPENGWTKGSLAEKFGWPRKQGNYEVSSLWLRSYVKIWNDWFRDENLKNPAHLDTSDATTQGTDVLDYDTDNPYDYVTGAETGAFPLKAAKPHDYFTSALPGMQRGPSTYIPLGQSAPVYAEEANTEAFPSYHQSTAIPIGTPIMMGRNPVNGAYGIFNDDNGRDMENGGMISLYTDLSDAVGATIAQLRQAFAIQRFYEALARNGSRYIEVLKGVYGTVNPDFRLQRSEYVGGFRLPLNISQVIQSDAGASDTTPLGHTGAMSHTADRKDDLFDHAFTEHGILLGVMVTRTDHTYQQGLNRIFTKFKMFDYYTPQLANLSEQAILNKEIYLANDGKDEEAFGYQECWAEYRYQPSTISGELASDYDQSLDVWTYADNYEERPYLSSEWIDETDRNIQRTLAVDGHDQLLYNFYFKPIWTRPMPVYSIPGLSSHF